MRKKGKHYFRSNLADIMKERSQELGFEITRQQIATATGLTWITIDKWFKGEPMSAIDAEIACTLMSYFGVSLERLVTSGCQDGKESDPPGYLALTSAFTFAGLRI